MEGRFREGRRIRASSFHRETGLAGGSYIEQCNVKTVRFIRDGEKRGMGYGGVVVVVVEVLLYVHRNRGFIRDGSPGRSPRLSQSS